MHPMAAVQTEYSLWTRNVELGVLETCEELGIALVAFSPLGRGALCGVLTRSLDARGQGPAHQDAALPAGQLAAEPDADRAVRRARRAGRRDPGATGARTGSCRAATTST